MKPTLKYDDIANADNYKTYMNNNKLYLAVYFFAIIVVQFIVNAYIITQTCGGNITQNMAASGSFTFIPWTLIFGAVVVVLIVYPGFKSAFSDVIGYFYVASSANKILTELLVNESVNEEIQQAIIHDNQDESYKLPLPSSPPIEMMNERTRAIPQGDVKIIGGATNKEIEQAADLIVKICGNSSILINQIVPSNFIEYWNILKPLMKRQFQIDGPESDEKRNQLFELVVMRDNVGEAMWYIYTGLLITSIVQLKISTRGCKTDPAQMAKNYQNYVKEQKNAEKQQQQATSSVYKVTG
jgi:hypothetical protein